MATFIITHNMIVEDELENEPIIDAQEISQLIIEIISDENVQFSQFLSQYRQIKE